MIIEARALALGLARGRLSWRPLYFGARCGRDVGGHSAAS
jgi:hypothetical protein